MGGNLPPRGPDWGEQGPLSDNRHGKTNPNSDENNLISPDSKILVLWQDKKCQRRLEDNDVKRSRDRKPIN